MAISLQRFIEDRGGLQGQANGGGLTSLLQKINFLNGGATTVSAVENADTIDVTITSTDTQSPVRVAQIVTTESVADGFHNTSFLVTDDTPPTTSEMGLMMTVVITPTNAASTLIFTGIAHVSRSGIGRAIIAITKDAETDSRSVSAMHQRGDQEAFTSLPIRYEAVAGSTSAQSWKLWMTGTPGQTTFFNQAGPGCCGAPRFGDTLISFISVMEVLP
jgi:hypothetical protein